MTESKAADLRKLAARGTMAVPGVPNALTAMLVEQAGFPAVYLSGAGLSNTAGYPDEGLLGMKEFVDQARHVARAVSIPVICDADTGFGGILNVIRTVKEFEAAGAAAIQLEDQESPKRCGHLAGKRLIAPEAMVQKIRAAQKGRSNPHFMIIARTDARHVTGLDDAIRRGKLYGAAGADGIFPEALESTEEFSLFAEEISRSGRDPILVANMTEFGKSPLLSVEELGRLGYQIVLFPQTLLRVALEAMRETLQVLKEQGTQKGVMERMMTRSDLYDLIRYNAYKQIDTELNAQKDGE